MAKIVRKNITFWPLKGGGSVEIFKGGNSIKGGVKYKGGGSEGSRRYGKNSFETVPSP